MSKARVTGFGLSVDGFSAGIEQSLSDPLGRRGPEIVQWFFHTRTFCSMHGQEGELLAIWTMNSPTVRWTILAPSSSVATCSVRCPSFNLAALRVSDFLQASRRCEPQIDFCVAGD